MLATEPDLQAIGLGKQMLGHAERYAQSLFAAILARMHVLSSRSELLQFYQRRGYVCTGEIDGYPVGAGFGEPLVDGLQVVVLAKRLTVRRLA